MIGFDVEGFVDVFVVKACLRCPFPGGGITVYGSRGCGDASGAEQIFCTTKNTKTRKNITIRFILCSN